MDKKKIENQKTVSDVNSNKKTFSDLNNKSWFRDGDKIKVGENFSKINSGEFDTLEIKDFLIGNPVKTFTIVITKDDKIYLLKSTRELR